MNFIIESTTTGKNGKSYKSYFQERIGCMSVTVCNPQEAKMFESKAIAETERIKNFGTRRTVKVITYESGTNNAVPGLVRQGHDSGIF